MFWLLACSVGPSGLSLPLTMEGDGVVAVVKREAGWRSDGVRVGLWGERFGTRGETRADVVADPDGSVWLHFRVDTGLGEAIAALRVEGNGAVLPLGARPGEGELMLKGVESLSVDRLQYAAETADRIREEQRLWQSGAFTIHADSGAVGEIQFRGDEPPVVGVADAWWLTPRPVEAVMEADGADLVVTFDVEPSFEGESAQLRVNVPMRTAVAPLGAVPVPEERRFTLVPGRLDDESRTLMNKSAVEASNQLEQRYVEDMGQRLATASLTESGVCSSWETLEPKWGVMFPGYEVSIVAVESGCAVELEPARVQHGRRYRGTISQ